MKLSFRSVLISLVCTCLVPVVAASVAPTAGVAAATEPTRQQVVNEAMKYLGYKYTWDGDSPQTGFSCIGLVSYVFRSLGIDMPGNLPGALASYEKIDERSLLPGDIVFFQNTWGKGLSHVALYIGDGEVIHAENPSTGVITSYLRNDPLIGNYLQQHYLVSERPLAGPTTPMTHGKREPQAIVTVPSLNMRQNHSLQAVVETVLLKGSVLVILGQWGNWVHVEMSDAVPGWVVKAGVQMSETSPSSGSGSGSHQSGTCLRSQAYPVVSGVNIHDGPALTDSVIAVTTPDMTVIVLGHRHGFAKIRSDVDVVGWVLSRFVESSPSASKGSGKKTHKTHAVGTLAITAHLRTGPSLNDSIIQWVNAGAKVKILGRVSVWDHVRVSSKLSGYIYSQYVKG